MAHSAVSARFLFLIKAHNDLTGKCDVWISEDKEKLSLAITNGTWTLTLSGQVAEMSWIDQSLVGTKNRSKQQSGLA